MCFWGMGPLFLGPLSTWLVLHEEMRLLAGRCGRCEGTIARTAQIRQATEAGLGSPRLTRYVDMIAMGQLAPLARCSPIAGGPSRPGTVDRRNVLDDNETPSSRRRRGAGREYLGITGQTGLAHGKPEARKGRAPSWPALNGCCCARSQAIPGGHYYYIPRGRTGLPDRPQSGPSPFLPTGCGGAIRMAWHHLVSNMRPSPKNIYLTRRRLALLPPRRLLALHNKLGSARRRFDGKSLPSSIFVRPVANDGGVSSSSAGYYPHTVPFRVLAPGRKTWFF